MGFRLQQEIVSYVHEGLSAPEMSVLFTIAFHADDNERMAFPSNELLASETRLGKSTVERAISSLADKGYLSRQVGASNSRKLWLSEASEWANSSPRKASFTTPTARVPTPTAKVPTLGERAPTPTARGGTLGARTEQSYNNQENNQENNQRTMPAPDGAGRRSGGGVVLRISPSEGMEAKAPNRNDVYDHLTVKLPRQMITNGWEARPGPANAAMVRNQIKRFVNSGDFDCAEIIELANVFSENPHLWNDRRGAPAHTLLDGEILARCRNIRDRSAVGGDETNHSVWTEGVWDAPPFVWTGNA